MMFLLSLRTILRGKLKKLCDNLIVEGNLAIVAPFHFYTVIPQITIQSDKIMEVQQSTVKIDWCSPVNINS